MAIAHRQGQLPSPLHFSIFIPTVFVTVDTEPTVMNGGGDYRCLYYAIPVAVFIIRT